MYERILVALDESPAAQSALAEAIKLAKLAGATIEVIYVVDDGKWPGDNQPGLDELPSSRRKSAANAAGICLAAAHDLLDEAAVRGNVRAIDTYGESAPAVLVRVANEINADLIVMGTHGRRGVQRFLLGSVAEALIRSTEIPVLVVRHDPARQIRVAPDHPHDQARG